MTLTLCALHPDPAIRHAVLAQCPSGVRVVSAASPTELVGTAPETTLVVLLDPARTDPADVVQACLVRPTLVSISALRLAATDLGVDAVLPLDRLTARRLSRLVFDLTQSPAMRNAS